MKLVQPCAWTAARIGAAPPAVVAGPGHSLLASPLHLQKPAPMNFARHMRTNADEEVR